MSTTSRPAGSFAETLPLVAGERLDQPEFHRRYEAMPPRTRAELVDGVVHMPSPMRSDHGEFSPDVIFWLSSYRRHTPGVRVADGAMVSLVLTESPSPMP